MRYLKIKIVLLVTSLLMALFSLIKPVHGQQDQYAINLRRNFGYGGGVNIRGTFTIHLVGDETKVESVTFFIDDEVIASLDDEPLNYRFNTDDYGFGTHRLWAEVQLLDGSTQRTSELQYKFISSTEARRQVGTLIGGLAGGILFTFAMVAVVQFLLLKGKRKNHTSLGNHAIMAYSVAQSARSVGKPFPGICGG